MGKYAFYIWTAYGAAGVILGANFLFSYLQYRKQKMVIK